MPDDYQHDPQTADEILPVVDLDDRQTGTATRREIHERDLIHRATHVILLSPGGRVLMQKRSESKDRFPGWWDISVGGHVGVDETYLETAVREIGEEMGLTEFSPPQLVGVQTPCDANGWEHIHIFVSTFQGEPRPDPKEIAGTRLVIAQELLDKADPESPEVQWRVTEGGWLSLREWKKAGLPGLSL